MKYILLLFCVLIVWSGLSGASVAAGRPPGVSFNPDPAPLTVTLTIPEDASGGNISDPDFHFSVIIRNVSDHPVTIWKRWCSEGAFNVMLYMDGIDGTSLKHSIELSGTDSVSWLANFPDPITLQPGDIDVRDYYILTSKYSSESTSFPAFKVNQHHSISLHAVLKIPADSNTSLYKVWSGTVESPIGTYSLWSDKETGDADQLAIEYSPFYSPLNMHLLGEKLRPEAGKLPVGR